jgi:hypothetical protein
MRLVSSSCPAARAALLGLLPGVSHEVVIAAQAALVAAIFAESSSAR